MFVYQPPVANADALSGGQLRASRNQKGSARESPEAVMTLWRICWNMEKKHMGTNSIHPLNFNMELENQLLTLGNSFCKPSFSSSHAKFAKMTRNSCNYLSKVSRITNAFCRMQPGWSSGHALSTRRSRMLS